MLACIGGAARGIDRRAVLLWLTGITVISGVVVAFAPTYPVFMVGRALIGMAIGGFWSMSAAMMIRILPAKERSARACGPQRRQRPRDDRRRAPQQLSRSVHRLARCVLLCGADCGTDPGLAIRRFQGCPAGSAAAFKVLRRGHRIQLRRPSIWMLQ